MKIFPTFLKENDKVGIIAPSFYLDEIYLQPALDILRSWNLDIVIGENVHKKHGLFSGNDEDRLVPIQRMFDEPEIKCIFCARGGYGVSKIVDKINLTGFRKSPKWIIGYSDVTLLSLHLYNHGFSSIHGPMLLNFKDSNSKSSLLALRNLIFNGKVKEMEFSGSDFNRQGHVSAPLIGGNLSMLIHSLGTPSEINTDGHILFLEEVNEAPFRIDRMITHLIRSGKLDKIKGIIVGHLTLPEAEESNTNKTQEIEKLIADLFRDFDFPLTFNFPAGHEMPNMPLVMGGRYGLMVTEKSSRLTFEQ